MSAETVEKSLKFGTPSKPTPKTNSNTVTVNIELENLKAEATSLGIEFAPKVKVNTLKELIAAKIFENLKAEATSLGIEFDENVDTETLKNLIAIATEGDN